MSRRQLLWRVTKFRNWLKARGTLQAREPNSGLAGLLRTPRPRERADFRTPRSKILTNPSDCPDYSGSRFSWKREDVLCACAVALGTLGNVVSNLPLLGARNGHKMAPERRGWF